MAEPDALKIKYREALVEAVQAVVREVNRPEPQSIAQLADALVLAADQRAFAQLLAQALRPLHEGICGALAAQAFGVSRLTGAPALAHAEIRQDHADDDDESDDVDDGVHACLLLQSTRRDGCLMSFSMRTFWAWRCRLAQSSAVGQVLTRDYLRFQPLPPRTAPS